MNLFIRVYFILFLVNVHFASYQLGSCFVHSLKEAHVLDAFMNRYMSYNCISDLGISDFPC